MRQLRLFVESMRCRHCVREVTRWLRDVPGVQTVVADARVGTVAVGGTMSVGAVLAVFDGSAYTPHVVDDPEAASA